MNVYTRGEKIDMFIEELARKAKMTFEIMLIVAGIAAMVAIGCMSKQITELETQIKEYEMEIEEMEQTSDEYITIRDSVTGKVIYSGWK